MKNRRSRYIVLALIILLIGLLTVPAIADAGNFSGGSNYGGSSGGGSWGGSSGGGSWGGGGATYYGGDSGFSGGGAVVIVIIFIVIAGSVVMKSMKAGGTQDGGGISQPVSGASMSPISALKEEDPNFSETAMKEKISNLYVQMQDAWQNKEFGSMRPHMTVGLYNQFDRQLSELIDADCTNYVDRVSVLGVDFCGWRQDEVNDIIEAIVNTRIVDYTVNDKTGQLVSGSKTTEKFMTYQWTLIRSIGMTTPEAAGSGSEGTSAIHCPSCGAPLEINQSAKCPYCDTVISAKDYDWAISEIRGLAQRNG